jgi:hypothetical protein
MSACLASLEMHACMAVWHGIVCMPSVWVGTVIGLPVVMFVSCLSSFLSYVCLPLWLGIVCLPAFLTWYWMSVYLSVPLLCVCRPVWIFTGPHVRLTACLTWYCMSACTGCYCMSDFVLFFCLWIGKALTGYLLAWLTLYCTVCLYFYCIFACLPDQVLYVCPAD